MSELESVIADELAKRHTPGVAVSAVEDGAVSWTLCVGTRGSGLPVEDRTIFEAASMSKPVTACVALHLADDGLLDLDKPLASYTSRWWIDDPRIDAITARHALTHQTGLWQDSNETAPYFERDPVIDFKYSNTGIEYLQFVCEEIAGESLEALASRIVFEPLGMADTSFVWRESYETTAATAHGDSGEPLEKWKPTVPDASSSLHTTAPDYGRFVAAVPSLNDEWLTPQIDVHEAWGAGPPLPGSTWGLGWGLQADGCYWHWGWNIGFLSFAVAWPAQRRGIAVFTNGQDGLWICKAVVRWSRGRITPRSIGSSISLRSWGGGQSGSSRTSSMRRATHRTSGRGGRSCARGCTATWSRSASDPA